MNSYVHRRSKSSVSQEKRNNVVQNHTVLRKREYYKFFCRYNEDVQNSWEGLMQGIIYTDRTCLIGIDVWRLLDRMDMCEYPYKNYPSLEAANVTVTPVPRCWYMDHTEK